MKGSKQYKQTNKTKTKQKKNKKQIKPGIETSTCGPLPSKITPGISPVSARALARWHAETIDNASLATHTTHARTFLSQKFRLPADNGARPHNNLGRCTLPRLESTLWPEHTRTRRTHGVSVVCTARDGDQT